ncbi:MAG TPA: porin [Planctomycetota bacterium]
MLLQLALLLAQDDGVPVEVSWRDGLRFKARDASWEGYLSGFVRVHGRMALDRPDDDVAPIRTVPDSVFLRGARLETGGAFRNEFGYRLQVDWLTGTVNQETGAAASTTSTKLRDAWVEWRRFPSFMVRVGQFYEPCELEDYGTGKHLEFAEKSALNRLGPGREQGIQIHGAWDVDVLRYFLMVSNGGGLVNDDGRSVPDANDEKELSGAIYVQPFGGFRLGLGGSITDVDDVAAGDFDQTTPELSALWLDPMAGTFDGLRRRADANVRWIRGPVQLRAQALWRDDELKGSAERRMESRGAFASLSWIATGEDKRADLRPVPAGDGGALELAVRACRVEFPNAEDAGLTGPADAERLTTLTFATTWWVDRFFRLSLDVVHERYGGGIDVDGEELDALTGFLLRAQVDF